MKHLALFCCLLFPACTYAQNLSATYAVTNPISIPTSEGVKHITLDLNGFLYRKGNEYIFWHTPKYLAKYPKGTIEFGNTIYPLNTDSIQKISYINYDTHIQRFGALNPSWIVGSSINENEFEEGFGESWWEYKPETKMIDGLKCQLALDRDQWRVWFCPDIPCRAGMYLLRGLPGLIVEADHISGNKHYKLLSYDAQTVIPDSVFTPPLFKGTIVKGEKLRNYTLPKEKTKQQKRLDLMNQKNN